MAYTAKEFVNDAYQLVSANNPVVTLQGNDNLKGIQFMNQLLKSFSASGLLTPIAKNVEFNVAIGQEEVTFGAADLLPVPDVTEGRLSNLQNAWLTLQGVTYPLIDESRNVFLGSYKYDPQLGLPRFCIIYNETNLTRMRLYPAPSQVYTLNVYGKFELPVITQNSDMSLIPDYMQLFLLFALAKYLAFFKGRASAWTPLLEDQLVQLKKDIESASSVNLVIDSANESYLNGSWRVKAGI